MANSQGKDKADLLARLKRIEGQVRGIQRMVDEDQYCVDILVQIAAVKSALNRVGFILLENHTRGCVARAIKNNDGDSAISELTGVIERFVK